MATKERDPRPAAEVLAEFIQRVQQPGSSRDIFMGVDPGAKGAIALLCGKRHAVFDIPTYTAGVKRVRQLNAQQRAATGKKTKQVQGSTTLFDYAAIQRLFFQLREIRPRIYAALEIAQVQISGGPRGNKNVLTAYRVGIAYGMWPLFLHSRGYSLEEFPPLVWKKAMGLTKQDKEFARQRALAMFPSANIVRKGDHDRAEALLLAEFLRRRHKGR